MVSIDDKKLKLEIISYLKRQPEYYGDISHIVNKFIKGNTDRKNLVTKRLHHLIRTDILVIKNLPKDPDQLKDWDWGTYLGHNPQAGYLAEDLKAALSPAYLKLSWWDKNPTKDRVIVGIFFALIVSVIAGLFTCNGDNQANKKTDTMKNKTIQDKSVQKQENVNATMNDTLHDKKDTVRDTLTRK